MRAEVPVDALSEEWNDFVSLTSGRHDKQDFSMKKDVLTHSRVTLLLSKGEGREESKGIYN